MELTHVLVQKWPFFQRFLFPPYTPGKSVLRYFRTKNRLFRLLKQEGQKVEKLRFFQRG